MLRKCVGEGYTDGFYRYNTRLCFSYMCIHVLVCMYVCVHLFLITIADSKIFQLRILQEYLLDVIKQVKENTVLSNIFLMSKQQLLL